MGQDTIKMGAFWPYVIVSKTHMEDLKAAINLENLNIYDKNLTESTCKNEIKNESSKPICIIVLGMAGSGKTTFVNKLSNYLSQSHTPPFIVNLDPAVLNVPYTCNIDIRDTIKYKDVMHQYNLGPNGAIMTSLNLFTTKFDKVLNIIKSKTSQYKYFIFDTPGQIEIFTWSASGTIVCETLASEFTTIVIHIVDSLRIKSPITFMSNMVYACSVLYKMKLPFLLVLNKSDIVNPSFAIEWMQDFENFQEAVETDQSYSANLVRSLSLVLDEFYSVINTIPVSSYTGDGLDKLVEALQVAAIEFDEQYKKQYELLKAQNLSKRKFDNEMSTRSSAMKDLEVPLAENTNDYKIEEEKSTDSDSD